MLICVSAEFKALMSLSSSSASSPGAVLSRSNSVSSELSGGYAEEETVLSYQDRKERAACLWKRHDKRKNVVFGDVVVARVFWKKSCCARTRNNCFYCLSRVGKCWNHQVEVSKEELELLLKSQDPILIP
jgi:hypothetical protein